MNWRLLDLPLVSSPSSSSWNDDGLRPPPVVNEKSCWLSGWASFAITIRELCVMTNAHVTVSPADSAMFDGGEPSLHVANSFSQVPTASGEIPYPEPGTTLARVRVFDTPLPLFPS